MNYTSVTQPATKAMGAASYKRKRRPDDTPATTPPPAKKQAARRPQQLCPNPRTVSIHQQFQQHYDVGLSITHLVNLCAHLTVLLEWGFAIDHTQLDIFITAFPVYGAALPQLRQSQMGNRMLSIPSYFEWLETAGISHSLTPADRQHQPVPLAILSEEALGCIQAEHPLSFLKARVAMEEMSRRHARV